MRNVFLGATALLLGMGISFAQVTPGAPTLATQIGNNSSNLDANTGESVQSGDNQKVFVSQIGTSNSAATYQENGNGTGGNLGTIYQNGSVGANSGHANLAELHQIGSINQSQTIQQGDGNSALTTQKELGYGSQANKSLIQQGTNNQAENNTAEVLQDGFRNQSRTLQRYDNSDALTRQYGGDNKASIDQKANPNHSDGHAAEIVQNGWENQSLITQDGEGARNMATAQQYGYSNATVQIQHSTAGTGGDGNNAYISQGDNDIPTMLGDELFTHGLIPIDNMYVGSYTLVSTGVVARQEQWGENNVAQISQWKNYSQAFQKQIGNDNKGHIVQNIAGDINGGSNRARQDQTGDGNAAGIAQNDSKNSAWQIQIGDNNKALSTQKGEHNLANINQFGNANYGTTAQRGECNQAVLNQYDGQSYSIEQNLGGQGGHNQANVLQQGPGGSQVGIVNCSIPDVDPGSFTDIPDLNIPDICPGC